MDSEVEFESSEEELDLTKDCHPIGHYINDRPELINQMFSVIKGNKLRAMLPPVLKDCDVEQLKLQCLDQLLGMSEKRINCILEGEILESSSESDVDDSDNDSDSSDDSSDEEDEPEIKQKKSRGKEEAGSSDKVGSAGGAPEQGKTLLEILELEMRARAIRALLNQSGEVNTEGKEVVVKKEPEENGTVVDLTECDDEPQPKKSTPTKEDESVSSFEKKIEKSLDKGSKEVEEKKKRKFEAELGLRNKFKKKLSKVYRSHQQRMESEEEPVAHESMAVKQEPVEPELPSEIVIEDPEDGEVSSSEDEGDIVEIKEEPKDSELGPQPEFQLVIEDEVVKELDPSAESITAIDNGAFVSNIQIGPMPEIEDKRVEDNIEDEQEEQETEEQQEREQMPSQEEELHEVSWRSRWLQREGMQKLVKSSKICAKVKKKLRNVGKVKEDAVNTEVLEAAGNSDSNSVPPTDVVEGSVEEYKRLVASAPEDTTETASPALSSQDLNDSGDAILDNT